MMAAEVLVLDAIPPSGGYMRIHDDDDNLDNNSGTNENSPAGSRHSSRPGTADGSQRNATNSQQAAQLGSPGREASNLSTRNNRRSRPGTPQQVRFGDGSRPGTPLLSEQNNHNNNKAAAVVPVGTTAADASASLTPEETKAIAYWHQAFVAAAAEVSFLVLPSFWKYNYGFVSKLFESALHTHTRSRFLVFFLWFCLPINFDFHCMFSPI
jgi:hypothetical protein